MSGFMQYLEVPFVGHGNCNIEDALQASGTCHISNCSASHILPCTLPSDKLAALAEYHDHQQLKERSRSAEQHIHA